MSMLKLAVLRQVAYAHSIRKFIRAILEKLIPGKWIDRVFAADDAEFDAKLDAAFAAMDVATATKDDYRKSVVEVLCGDVSRLCEVLKAVCEGSGYGDYFEAHVSHERFVRLVLGNDSVKLGKMKKIVADEALSPIDMLRGIGAVLNDESLEERAALCARERRRANAELRSIAADVKSTMRLGFAQANQKMIECKEEIKAVGEKVDAVAAKVRQGSRRCKYDDETVALCMACVEAAKGNAEVRNSAKTKMTLRAAYAYHHRKLEASGVGGFDEFSKIVHACRARESRDRIKKLEAKRDAARALKSQSAKQVKPPRKFDILRGR